MSLKEFIAEVKTGGISKSDKYVVGFSTPTKLTSYNPSLKKILMFCESVQLPGVNISSQQNRSFGEFREAPYDRLFDNVQMTFYVDKKMEVKRFFDEWIACIQDPDTRSFSYYNDYITPMTIKVLDGGKGETGSYMVHLEECYPKSIGPVQLSYADKNFMTVTVTMNYRSWRSFTVDATPTEEKKNFFDGIESTLYNFKTGITSYTDNFRAAQRSFFGGFGL